MGVTNFDVIRANMILGPVGMGTQGKVIHVKPISGADGHSGLTPEEAVKTLSQALSLATANQNDIVLLYAESNTASATTDYQSTTLNWNKDLVHLIGVGANSMWSNRARIAGISGTVVTPTMTVSADGCMIKNISVVGGNTASDLIALTVTGSRNVFEDMHIYVGTGPASAANAADLKLDAAEENVFRRCTIGVDTVSRDADSKGNLWVDGGASRNCFDDCLFPAFTEHVGYEHVTLEDTTAIDRFLIFRRCLFLSIGVNYGTPQDQIFSIPALTQGLVILQNCDFAGCDNGCVWQTTGVSRLRVSDTVASGAAGELLII